MKIKSLLLSTVFLVSILPTYVFAESKTNDVSVITIENYLTNNPIQQKIPKKMNPGTIITYNQDKEPTITTDSSNKAVTKSSNSEITNKPKEFVDKNGRTAEDSYVNSM